MSYRKTAKATSWLIIFTCVFPTIPAYADTYVRIDDNEGTIYNAEAYKNGNFYIDGQIKELGENVYHLFGDKYIKLNKIDNGSAVNIYGEKYLEIEDEDYYIDLNTGKIIDENIKEDDKDEALRVLRKKINKDNDGRYLEDIDIRDNNIYEIENNKFLKPWYYTKLEGNASKEFLLLTDKEGNYIDADHNVGKISIVFDKLINKNNRLSFENTKEHKYNLKVNICNDKVICQDESYIYRLAYLYVTYDNNNEVTNVTTDSSISFGGYNNAYKVNALKIINQGKEIFAIPVIQKISKEEAKDTIDGAKYAKNVDTYFLTNDKGASLETNKLLENFIVNDGEIITYGFENDKFKAYSIALKSKKGYYYTDFSDGVDMDAEDVKDVDTSADGELWILESGFIKKFNNDDEFEKIYKVDGSMNKFSVYNKENIITWNEDNEIYSIITKEILNKSQEVKEDNKPVDNWIQNTDGTWSYLNENGTKKVGWVQSLSSKVWYYMNADGVMVSNCWIYDNYKWYHFNENGAMETGWTYTDKNWYYLDFNGSMKTGWFNDKGTWYYLDSSGAMLHNTFVNGYYLGDNGAWIK